jgi:hypothetical protein
VANRTFRPSFRVGLAILFAIVSLAGGLPSATVAQSTADGGGGGYFGAPVLEYTRLRGQDALVLGGRGGWYVTRGLVVGGGLYGTVTEVDASGAGMNAPGPLDLKLERFGLELEYHVSPAAPTHLTLGGFIGGAALRHVRDGTNDQHGETDFLFALAPAVGIERVVTGWMHLNLAVSYRFVTGAEPPGPGERRLHGPGAALALKLGRF